MFFQFNWLDYCFIGLICFSTLMGFARGLVQELSSVANWVLGLWSGAAFYEVMASRLPDVVQPLEVRYVVGFFSVFGSVLISVTMLSKSVRWVIKSIGLKGPDSILGVFFGGFRGALFVALFILVAKTSSFAHSEGWQYSVLIPYFEPLEHWLEGCIPHDFSSSQPFKRNGLI